MRLEAGVALSAGMLGFLSCLRVQNRVLYAIIIRDVGSRHGGEGIGTLWLLLEPVIITLIVMAIHEWSGVQGATTEVVVIFLLTGYVPHLLFRHAGVAGLSALKGNAALLSHRQVHFMDLVVARLFIEIVTVIVAFTLIYVSFVYVGIIGMPRYISYTYLGWFVHVWFIVAASFIVTGAGLRWPLVRRMFPPFALLMLPAYAAFFMMSSISPAIRYYLLFLPCADASEIMRFGYFGDSALTFFDIPYSIIFLIFMTYFGLVCILSGRRYLEV